MLPEQRARLLDAEMQLERAWLELNLREARSASRDSLPFSPWKLGLVGLSIFKNRSLWVAGLSLLLSLWRRRSSKETHREAPAQTH
jgi:hypothetical protein